MGHSHITWGLFLHYAEQRLKESAAEHLSLHCGPSQDAVCLQVEAQNRLTGTDLQVCQSWQTGAGF